MLAELMYKNKPQKKYCKMFLHTYTTSSGDETQISIFKLLSHWFCESNWLITSQIFCRPPVQSRSQKLAELWHTDQFFMEVWYWTCIQQFFEISFSLKHWHLVFIHRVLHRLLSLCTHFSGNPEFPLSRSFFLFFSIA